jgi:hypothetical protein
MFFVQHQLEDHMLCFKVPDILCMNVQTISMMIMFCSVLKRIVSSYILCANDIHIQFSVLVAWSYSWSCSLT